MSVHLAVPELVEQLEHWLVRTRGERTAVGPVRSAGEELGHRPLVLVGGLALEELGEGVHHPHQPEVLPDPRPVAVEDGWVPGRSASSGDAATSVRSRSSKKSYCG